MRIRKRSGEIVKFEQEKITNAIYKAALATGHKDKKLAKQVSDGVVVFLKKHFKKIVPGVEDVQDIVEKELIKRGYVDIAKSYILYREERKKVREFKTFFGVKDDLKLEINAIRVLKRRYLLKDDKGNVIETPSQMFRRVARAVAKADLKYGDVRKIEKEFYDAMANLEFLPNSPTLMNAGTELGQLSACFVLPVGDSIKEIFGAVSNMALIHQSGGGTGFSFSKLRPKGDIVKSTKGIASGPVSFMRVFDTATDVIKQGGRRRGANMAILNIEHPDILEFVSIKSKEDVLSNFNLSVAVDDKFMGAVKTGKFYNLVNPRTKKVIGKLKASDVFNLIVSMAWKCGDPGIVFLDEINRKHVLFEKIEATNPCGEQPLLAYESCNLGSVNLSKVVRNGKIDFEKLRKLVRLGVHFLDNVIEINKFPLPEIEKRTRENRKIGLGVMGWADMLAQLGIPYDSERAVKLAEKVMSFISKEAKKMSVELAKKRGSFPSFKKSKLGKYGKMRNATVTTIAPTGSISVIAGCSSGIEPLFAVCFVRSVMEGTKLLEVNKYFEEIARKKGFYSKELMMEIAKKGSIQSINKIPKAIRRLFVTALDIKPEWHVKMQAAFQKYTDNAVSKTINLPENASVDDVRNAYLLAYKLKCKGITVYRYGSKKRQVLYLGAAEEHVHAESEYGGGCPAEPVCPF